MARALSEAYVQDGLLSYAELQLVFLTSHATIGRALDAYQRQHGIILPSPDWRCTARSAIEAA